MTMRGPPDPPGETTGGAGSCQIGFYPGEGGGHSGWNGYPLPNSRAERKW